MTADTSKRAGTGRSAALAVHRPLSPPSATARGIARLSSHRTCDRSTIRGSQRRAPTRTSSTSNEAQICAARSLPLKVAAVAGGLALLLLYQGATKLRSRLSLRLRTHSSPSLCPRGPQKGKESLVRRNRVSMERTGRSRHTHSRLRPSRGCTTEETRKAFWGRTGGSQGTWFWPRGAR